MNQRQIKFRAWDNVRLKMCPWESMAAWMMSAIENENIMQFTGLLDRTGREIYDGDIIETPNPKIEWEIFWGNYDGIWGWLAKTINGHYALDKSVQKGEIIGNIYENPELQNHEKQS